MSETLKIQGIDLTLPLEVGPQGLNIRVYQDLIAGKVMAVVTDVENNKQLFRGEVQISAPKTTQETSMDDLELMTPEEEAVFNDAISEGEACPGY